MIFQQTLCISACPDGFTAFDGDIPGPGLKGYYNASVQKCSNDCNDYWNTTFTGINDCNGFEHSANKSSCKLVTQPKPTNNTKYQDFQFCSRFGECSLLKFDTYYPPPILQISFRE